VLYNLSIGVRDLVQAGAFYDAVMGALWFLRLFEHDTDVGYGIGDGNYILSHQNG